MTKYYLKRNVTEKILEERGFTFLDTPAGKAAIRSKQKEEDEPIIIILNPPIREVKHRYSSSTRLLSEDIVDIMDLLEIKKV
jgi:hypothetical protein